MTPPAPVRAFNRSRLSYRGPDGTRVFDDREPRLVPPGCVEGRSHHYMLDVYGSGNCKHCRHHRDHHPVSDYGFGAQQRDDTPVPEGGDMPMGVYASHRVGWIALSEQNGHYMAGRHGAMAEPQQRVWEWD